MNSCMIIPTYWSTPNIHSWKIFDHPVPVSEEGTLARTLDNLEAMEYPDPIILFPAPCDSAIESKVRSIAVDYSIDIRIFTETDQKKVITTLEKTGFPRELLKAVDLGSYGGIRNAGLLYAAIHGFENIVMIDDDECIDKGYHEAAHRHMGKIVRDVEVLGKTGCVVDESGQKYYDGQTTFVTKEWPKDLLFNENVKKELEAKDRLCPCTVAFGGNMVIHQNMFRHVPFDPYGSRGEDDDYVLNARYFGLPFFFDQDFLLLHLPPKRQGAFWTRQRQDIIRFKYLREKVRLFGFDPKSLGSFMEYFTQEDLEYKAVASSIHAAQHFIDTDRTECIEFLNNAIVAESTPVSLLHDRAETFLRFMEAWNSILPGI